MNSIIKRVRACFGDRCFYLTCKNAIGEGGFGCFINNTKTNFASVLENSEIQFEYNNKDILDVQDVNNPRELIINKFKNNEIGFKIFFKSDYYNEELKNLNLLIDKVPACIEHYTTLSIFDNNVFGFILKHIPTPITKHTPTPTSTSKIINFRYKTNGRDINSDEIYVIMYKICEGDTTFKHKFDPDKFMKDITPLMSALHQNGFAHMDLKKENILYCKKCTLPLSTDFCYKVTDFNIVRIDNITDVKEINKRTGPNFIGTPTLTLTLLGGEIDEYLQGLFQNAYMTYYSNLAKINNDIIKHYYEIISKNNIIAANSFIYKKSDEYAIALTLLELLALSGVKSTSTPEYTINNMNVKKWIYKLLIPTELYFQNQLACKSKSTSQLPSQLPSPKQLTAGGGNTNKPLIKTKEKITIAGRVRTLYIGAHKKQYVKIKGIYVSVTSLRKAEKLKQDKNKANTKAKTR